MEASNLPDLVARIQRREPSGTQELFEILRGGFRNMFLAALPAEDVDEALHDAFIGALQAIQGGMIRDPERIMGLLKVICSRRICEYLEDLNGRRKRNDSLALVFDTLRDHRPNPEQALVKSDRHDTAVGILASLSAQDRDILTRFYFRDQGPAQIMAELNITKTQYRLRKSQALARCRVLGRQLASREALAMAASLAARDLPLMNS